MTTRVEKSITVDAPLRTVYDQWTQFEEFPRFMGGITEVRQTSDTTTHWVAEIAGVRREWDAAILDQVPDTRIAWAATTGATNAGAVSFVAVDPGRTQVLLVLEHEPEGLVEKAGDALGIVEKQAQGDLERFKTFIEERGTETGGWRGEVLGTAGTPTVDDAALSRGDSGTNGTTTAAKVAGAAAAAAVGVAAAAALSGGSEEEPVATQQPVQETGGTTTDRPYGVPHVIASEPGTDVDEGDPYPDRPAVTPLPEETTPR